MGHLTNAPTAAQCCLGQSLETVAYLARNYKFESPPAESPANSSTDVAMDSAHPARGPPVRHNDRLHDTFLLGHLSLWWKCCSVGKPVRHLLPGAMGRSRPIWTVPAGRVHRWARVAHGRTRMIAFPLRRPVRLKATTASSRVAMLPMFVRSRPSRTRWTI